MSGEGSDAPRRLLQLRPAGQLQLQRQVQHQVQQQLQQLQRRDVIACSPEESSQLIPTSPSSPALKNGGAPLAGLAGQAGSPTSIVTGLSYSSSSKR